MIIGMVTMVCVHKLVMSPELLVYIVIVIVTIVLYSWTYLIPVFVCIRLLSYIQALSINGPLTLFHYAI